MAEYYPLLAKAVAGLPNATPEIRRAVYERARAALLAQLQNLDPPIAESDVARETDALDRAVARLEAELAAASGAGNGAGTVSEDGKAAASAGAEKPAPEPRRESLGEQGPPAPQPPAAGSADASASSRWPLGRVAPPNGGTAFRSIARPGPAAPAASASKLAGRPDPAPADRESPFAAAINAPKRPDRAAPKPPALPVAPADLDDTDILADPREDSAQTFEDLPFADLPKPRIEGARLYAPRPPSEEGRGSLRMWLVGGIVAVVVAAVAIAAWALRDRPEELAKLKPQPTQQTETGGKIADRIGGPKAEAPANDAAAGAAAPMASPATNPDNPAPAAPAQTQPAPAQPAPAQQAQATAPKPADSNATVPVAYRAALLVDAPDQPNKYKTYEGTVVWRLDNVSSGSGQPLGTAVHADIDVPSDKLKVGLTLQKNTDPSLPASHTITIDFIVHSDTLTGGVKQIGVPQLRLDNVPTGDSLIGVPVPTVENSFLVGLSRGSAEATNLDLLKNRAWIDIPILLGNGKIAKLTFEKGTTGARALDEAITAWHSQQGQ